MAHDFPNQKFGWVLDDDGNWSLYDQNGQKIAGSDNSRLQVPTPVDADDSANKDYVDTHGGGGSISVTDGSTTVSPATSIDFTSGGTVTDEGGGVAGVSVSGGSMPGALRVLTFDFDYTQAVELATGVEVWTPTIGDILWDATIINPPTNLETNQSGWAATVVGALADIGFIDAGAFQGNGFFNYGPGPMDLTTDWDCPFQPPTIITPVSENVPYMLSLAPANVAIVTERASWSGPVPMLFLRSTPLSLVVSGDGTPSGDPTDATAGASKLCLVVSTPQSL